MRTVYLGTSDFAATVLDRLAGSPHRPQLVVTRPDAPRGRGRKLAPPPVAETAGLLGIEVFQPEDVNSEQARQRIAAAEPEAIAICAYGALIKEPLLSEHEMLNVHPSLLPRWRGAAPVERAIEAGDEETGVSIMRPTAEFDAGPVAVQRAERIRPDDDYGSLAPRLAALGGELLVEALDLQPAFRDQPDTGVTYAEKIGPEDRRLDPELSADLLERQSAGAHSSHRRLHRAALGRAPRRDSGHAHPRRRPAPRRARDQRRPPALRRDQRRPGAPGGASGREAPDGRGGLDSRLRGAGRRVSR